MVDEGAVLSGYIAFTAFLSLFPFLIFLAALASFLGTPDTAHECVEALFRFMTDSGPPAVQQRNMGMSVQLS